MTPLATLNDHTTLVPPGVTHELIRGHEQILVERISPMVRAQNVALDLSEVERIDAAGIAALITLYGHAQKAGYHFSVVNAPPRVAEILAIVGLDHILIEPDTVRFPCVSRSAA